MMEQKKYNQIDTKTPDIQSMILSYQIGGIAYELSQRLDISPSRALDLFYRSKTCKQLHDKRTGLYLMSNGYVADDFILEILGSCFFLSQTFQTSNYFHFGNSSSRQPLSIPQHFLCRSKQRLTRRIAAKHPQVLTF